MNEGGEEGVPPRWRDAEGRAVVPHGFRSSFRDWAGETRPEGGSLSRPRQQYERRYT